MKIRVPSRGAQFGRRAHRLWRSGFGRRHPQGKGSNLRQRHHGNDRRRDLTGRGALLRDMIVVRRHRVRMGMDRVTGRLLRMDEVRRPRRHEQQGQGKQDEATYHGHEATMSFFSGSTKRPIVTIYGNGKMATMAPATAAPEGPAPGSHFVTQWKTGRHRDGRYRSLPPLREINDQLRERP